MFLQCGADPFPPFLFSPTASRLLVPHSFSEGGSPPIAPRISLSPGQNSRFTLTLTFPRPQLSRSSGGKPPTGRSKCRLAISSDRAFSVSLSVHSVPSVVNIFTWRPLRALRELAVRFPIPDASARRPYLPILCALCGKIPPPRPTLFVPFVFFVVNPSPLRASASPCENPPSPTGILSILEILSKRPPLGVLCDLGEKNGSVFRPDGHGFPSRGQDGLGDLLEFDHDLDLVGPGQLALLRPVGVLARRSFGHGYALRVH